MNKSVSVSFFKKKRDLGKQKYIKLVKYNNSLKKNMNYCNSTIELKDKKNNNTFNLKNKYQNYSKNANRNNYKNTSIENIKLSKKIFNNLNKIHETLLEDYKKSNLLEKHQKKEQNKENQEIINKSVDIKEKNQIEKKKKNNIIKVIKNFNINNDNQHHNLSRKSKTTINFFPIRYSSPKKINKSLNSKTSPHSPHHTIKTHENKKPHQITRYLERRKINDLPVTFPLFLSHNNKYNSVSEKNRVDKILNKLICLKTNLIRDPLNKVEIIKEFFLKNGFDKDIYFQEEKIINFFNYLKKPFAFPPEYNLEMVINEGINFISDDYQEDNNDIDMVNYYVPNRTCIEFYENNNTKVNNSSNENEITYNVFMEEIFKKRYKNYENLRNKTLPTLIKDLEHELRQIKIEKMNKLDI